MTAPPPPPAPPPSQPNPPTPPGYGPGGGPIGAQRNIGKQIGLSIITLGFYGYYWSYRSHEDIKLYSGQGVGGVVGMVIYILVGIVTLFLLPVEIKNMYEQDGRESPVGPATAAWILLFGIPWYVKCQAALNDFWASKGAPPAP